MALVITESEILEELRRALTVVSTGPEDVFTAGEMAQASGICIKRLRLILGRLKLDGRIECLRVIRESLDGRQTQVPGYRFIGKKARARR